MTDETRGEGDLVVTTSDGRDVGVRVWGNPAGAPIFWLHGTPGSRMLRDPTDTYVRHGLAVRAYDRPGYGLSTRRPGRTQGADRRRRGRRRGRTRLGSVRGCRRIERIGARPCCRGAPSRPGDPVRRDRGGGAFCCRGGTGSDAGRRLAVWEREARGDEGALAKDFDEFLEWFDAGMPGRRP